MIKSITSVIIFLLIQVAYSQSQEQVDSINKIIVQGAGVSSDSLVKLFEENIEHSQSLKYLKGEADALSKLSLVYYYQGKYEDNVSTMLEAINLYDSLKLESNVAQNYGELGYQMKRRDLPTAMHYMQKGKSIAERINDEEVILNIYNNYGVLKEMNQELDSALYFYKKGLVLKEKRKDSLGIPYSLYNIAGIHTLRKDFVRARQYLNLALNKRINLRDSIGIAESLTSLAEIDILTNNTQNAISLFHQSNSLARKKSYRFLEQYNYKFLSEAFKKINIADSALFYFERSIEIKDSISNLDIEKTVAGLRVEFETERKERELLQERALLAEKELEVKRKNQLLFGSITLAVILALLGYLLYNQQKLKNRQLQKESELKQALIKIETQNRLQEQRLRISRDLHDNIGAQLTFVISSLDNLKYGFKDMDGNLSSKIDGISSFTSQTICELRDTIWAMNKNEITFEDLQVRISNFIDSAKIANEKTSFSFKIDSNVNSEYRFSSVQGMNIYRIIQEAVNNALKYSEADTISVEISNKQKTFIVRVEDNGKGFDLDKINRGNGLNNMNKRASELGTTLMINSIIGKGTKITFEVS
jgi:signal transduction histidine kinase